MKIEIAIALLAVGEFILAVALLKMFGGRRRAPGRKSDSDRLARPFGQL